MRAAAKTPRIGEIPSGGRGSGTSPALDVTVIRPPGRWAGLGLGELWRFRAIAVVLARRSFKVRYRQTLLGAAWAILQPVLLMVAFTVFFGIIGRMPRQGDIPFPVFFIAGIIVWHPAARVLSQATVSLVQNAAIIEKVYFPRVFFPLSAAFLGLVDLLFSMIPLVAILAWFGIIPGIGAVLFPLFIAIGFVTALGVAFWTSALNAKYRDVAQVLPFLTQLWFFSSPVIYAAAFVPEPWDTVYYLNPMALAVTGSRWVLTGLPAPPPEAWIISPTVAILVFLSGYFFFRSREPTLDDVL